jgi:diguanylate cyclase (GGDEF)-like protein/PAS domain S-box-containing protein
LTLQIQQLLELLRRALHDRTAPEALPREYAAQEELVAFYGELIELRRCILAVAAGDLSNRISLKGYTAGAMKTLQANLNHLSWQTQMIASGDFSQRLDFMGDFSKAFNSMTEQLENAARTIKEKEVQLSAINAGLLREIENRKQVQAALVESEAHYRNLTETMQDVVWILDTATLRFTYISPSVKKLRGFTPEEIIDQPFDAAFTPDSVAFVREAIKKQCACFLSGEVPPEHFYTSEIEQPCKDGGTVWTEVVVHYVYNEKTGSLEVHGVSRDITDRRALRLELLRQATIDDLTGVANRRHFLACAEKEIQRSRRHGNTLSFLMLDIDHFKLVNDTFGHAVGDLALQAVAKTCTGLLRSSDSIGRLGGEEFALLLVETDIAQAAMAAERLRQEIEEISLSTAAGEPVLLTVSVGVTEWRGQSDTLSTLMVRADQALYQAKNGGRNRIDVIT